MRVEGRVEVSVDGVPVKSADLLDLARPVKKPMLAPTAGIVHMDRLRFPLIASPKLDGIRSLKRNGGIVSRSFKPIPNEYIRTTLQGLLPEGADGETITGNNFQDVSSGVMSKGGTPDFKFWMFDYVPSAAHCASPYTTRLQWQGQWYRAASAAYPELSKFVRIVPTTTIYSMAQLLSYEAECLGAGFEGAMLRDPEGPYKEGRATEKQGWLLKLKRFTDAEATVVGFEEQEANHNEVTVDALGHSKRSSHKSGKVGKGTLGKLVCESPDWEGQFRIGTGKGLTDAKRLEIWNNRELYLGRSIKYKYQKHGSKNAPRIAIYLGFRHQDDM